MSLFNRKALKSKSENFISFFLFFFFFFYSRFKLEKSRSMIISSSCFTRTTFSCVTFLTITLQAIQDVYHMIANSDDCNFMFKKVILM